MISVGLILSLVLLNSHILSKIFYWTYNLCSIIDSYDPYKAAFDSIEIYKYLIRAYPGTARGTDERDATYKIRVGVEKSIHHFKDSFCVAGRKTQNEKTLHADLLLVGNTQFITVLVAVKLHKHEYIRSLKPLIA